MSVYDTLYVNLYGGPGTGKSTTAALVFGMLKRNGYEAELVTEFAKEVVWEKRNILYCQPYIYGKQLWRLERLRGQVQVVVTDSPILLSAYYGAGLGPAWREVVRGAWHSFRNLDVYLVRDEVAHPYSSVGRVQATVEHAKEIDLNISEVLDSLNIEATSVIMGDESSYAILDMVLEELG